MSGRIDRKAMVKAWVEKAENDARAMKALLALGKESPSQAVCFHAQQRIEKYLKACLTQNDIEFGKTHDIREILDL